MLGCGSAPIVSPLCVGGLWRMSVCLSVSILSANLQWHVLSYLGSMGSLAVQGLTSPLAPSSSCSPVYMVESSSAVVSSWSPAM